jgi:ribonuclease HI
VFETRILKCKIGFSHNAPKHHDTSFSFTLSRLRCGDSLNSVFQVKFKIMCWLSVTFFVGFLAVPGFCLLIVLQFDGSLRPPTDVGAPTHTLGQMAACACSLNGVENIRELPRLLGGKGLSPSSTMTSAEVEYEGLLFGLKSLRTYLAACANVTNLNNLTILVQGDCKSVMKQMSGRAVPRKLQHQHRVASALVRCIEEEFSMEGSSCTFQFQHIPRTSNVLCDQTSACIVAEQQRKALEDVWSELLLLEGTVKDMAANGVERVLDQWFQLGRSVIPLTIRPRLYQRMAAIAMAMQDFTGLLTLSVRYEEDIRILQNNIASRRQSYCTSEYNASYGAGRADAVLYQIMALKALGRSKESLRKYQTNRILLEKNPQNILEMEHQLPSPLINLSGFVKSETSTNSEQNGGVDWPPPVLHWKNEAFESPEWKADCEYICLINSYDDQASVIG